MRASPKRGPAWRGRILPRPKGRGEDVHGLRHEGRVPRDATPGLGRGNQPRPPASGTRARGLKFPPPHRPKGRWDPAGNPHRSRPIGGGGDGHTTSRCWRHRACYRGAPRLSPKAVDRRPTIPAHRRRAPRHRCRPPPPTGRGLLARKPSPDSASARVGPLRLKPSSAEAARYLTSGWPVFLEDGHRIRRYLGPLPRRCVY